MERKIIRTAAFLGMTAIILGAFGAHALKKHVTAQQLVVFETGVRYQMYHALFLLFLGMNAFLDEKAKKWILQLVIFGVFFFSGSLYVLATKNIFGIDPKTIGFLTPIGGALLIGAWGVLLCCGLKKKV